MFQTSFMNGADSRPARGPVAGGGVTAIAPPAFASFCSPSLEGQPATKTRAAISAAIRMRESYRDPRFPGRVRRRRRLPDVHDARADEEVVHRALRGMDRGERETRPIEEGERRIADGEGGEEAAHLIDLRGLAYDGDEIV